MARTEQDYQELKRKIDELDVQMSQLSGVLDKMLEKMDYIESSATGIETNIRKELQELQELIHRNDRSRKT